MSTKSIFLFACLLSAMIASAQTPANKTLACAPQAESVGKLLAMNQGDFDDSPQGWRMLAHDGCELEAAFVIDAYLANSPPQLKTVGREGLAFHAGQMYAYAGLSEIAALRFFEALDPHEKRTGEIAWNAYVLASIAFLKHDKDELTHQRSLLAAAASTKGNQMNLRVVDRFLHCFDRPYRETYEQCDR
jgi:hypothetical protein